MIDLPVRFWQKVKVNPCTQCWEWQGYIDQNGYGMFRFGKKMVKPHRLINNTPKHLDTDHLCNNRKCCNPMHLESVPHTTNVKRGNAGAKNRNKTHCRNGHEYTPDNILWVTEIERRCKICNRTNALRSYYKRKH